VHRRRDQRPRRRDPDLGSALRAVAEDHDPRGQVGIRIRQQLHPGRGYRHGAYTRRRPQRVGLTTPAEPPPRRTGSAATSTLPLGRISSPLAVPIVDGMVIVGSSGDVLLTANF
jgi:hypothetical protein